MYRGRGRGRGRGGGPQGGDSTSAPNKLAPTLGKEPPALFPELLLPVPPTPGGAVDDRLLVLKASQLRQRLSRSPFYVRPAPPRPDVERYSDSYKSRVQAAAAGGLWAAIDLGSGLFPDELIVDDGLRLAARRRRHLRLAEEAERRAALDAPAANLLSARGKGRTTAAAAGRGSKASLVSSADAAGPSRKRQSPAAAAAASKHASIGIIDSLALDKLEKLAAQEEALQQTGGADGEEQQQRQQTAGDEGETAAGEEDFMEDDDDYAQRFDDDDDFNDEQDGANDDGGEPTF